MNSKERQYFSHALTLQILKSLYTENIILNKTVSKFMDKRSSREYNQNLRLTLLNHVSVTLSKDVIKDEGYKHAIS